MYALSVEILFFSIREKVLLLVWKQQNTQEQISKHIMCQLPRD